MSGEPDEYEQRALGIGARIAHLRQKQRLSLDDLAERTAQEGHRVDPTAIWRFEAGQRRPTVVVLWVLADALGTTAAHLMGEPE